MWQVFDTGSQKELVNNILYRVKVSVLFFFLNGKPLILYTINVIDNSDYTRPESVCVRVNKDRSVDMVPFINKKLKVYIFGS